MTHQQKSYSFLAGRFVITANAFNHLNLWDAYWALLRHACARSADLCPLPNPGRKPSVRERCRHFTTHLDRHGTAFLILTEGDLSRTEIMLANEL